MAAMPEHPFEGLSPRGGVWTVDDLDSIPEDGLQYELAEGVLLVTPSPRPLHQRMAARLFKVLSSACPDHLEVFFAPLDVRPTRTTSLQPDVLVVRREDIGEESLMGMPLLVVEVLSPSTRAKDVILKRALYADAGVPSYWLLDPSEVTAVVLELEGGELVERASARSSEVLQVRLPFACSFTPEDLVR